MARFNTSSPTLATNAPIYNRAGGSAFQESKKLQLVSLLLTSVLQEQFYQTSAQQLNKIQTLVATLPDKQFAAKAAVFARHEYGLRSISHVVAGEVARHVKGEQWTKRFFENVVQRVDDITEILAYYGNAYGKPFPNALKKGLASAFEKFDGYQLAKYRAKSKDVSLVDAVNLLHPRATPQNSEALRQLIAGNLVTSGTWETKLTQAGQSATSTADKAERKREAWVDLLQSGKLGTMALVRNLRNIITQAPEMLENALGMLTDARRIHAGRLMPFQYMTAYKEIQILQDNPALSESARLTMMALDYAIDTALCNVPQFDGRTLVALDTSGSMAGKPFEIGSLFAAVLCKRNNADLLTFSSQAQFQPYNPLDSVLSIAQDIPFSSGGTNFNAIFEHLTTPYTRMVILSDMQGWMNNLGSLDSGESKETFAAYKVRTNATPKVFSFDLQGYGTLMFPEPDVYCLAGFSEKVFDVMRLMEQDRNALIHAVEAVEF